MKKLCLNDLHCVSGGGLGVGAIISNTSAEGGEVIVYYREKETGNLIGKLLSPLIEIPVTVDQLVELQEEINKDGLYDMDPVLSTAERNELTVISCKKNFPGKKYFMPINLGHKV